MTVADASLEDRLARLERSRNSALIVAAAAIVAAAVAIVLPYLPLPGSNEIVLRDAEGKPTVVLSGETGTARLHGVAVLNNQDKVKVEIVPTKLGGEVPIFNSEDEPVAVLNNSSPSQGGRLSLFGIGNRAAFFGGTVTDNDFGMEIRMRPGYSAVVKMVDEAPFFSLSDPGAEALMLVEDGIAEMFLNRFSILGPDALRRIELVGEENGARLRMLDVDDGARLSLRSDDEAGATVEIGDAAGERVWRAP